MDPRPHRSDSPPAPPPLPPASVPPEFHHGGIAPPPGAANSTLPYRPAPSAQPAGHHDGPPAPPSEGISSYHTGPQTQTHHPSSYSAPPPQQPSSSSSSAAYHNATHHPPPPLTHAPPIPIPDDPTPKPQPGPAPALMPASTQPTSSLLAPANATTTTSSSSEGLGAARSDAQAALREYMNLQRQRAMVHGVGLVNGTGGPGAAGEAAARKAEERVRAQAGIVLARLNSLRADVARLVEGAEAARWRRFLVGGVFASIIPIVKALFRRPRHDEDSSNDTEYAFKKSRSLISRILASTRRPGIATVAFFVFAVLYVFQNEVTLRAGRSVQKRLQRLADKVERSGGDVTEEDIKLLSGWRWRILTWAS